MYCSMLEKSPLFKGIPANDVREDLAAVHHYVQSFEKGEAVFHLLSEANKIGVLLEGRVQAQKPFPNGSQVNVSTRLPGDMIGPAAAFSLSHRYPCDVVALEPSKVLMFHREDLLLLMQKDSRIQVNFMSEIATAAYMLQQRLELLSYSGIAQKAAFYLLIHARESGKKQIPIPESVSNWAMVMNVSRSSLHRELKKLETEGVIAYAPPFIKILNEKALQNVLNQ